MSSCQSELERATDSAAGSRPPAASVENGADAGSPPRAALLQLRNRYVEPSTAQPLGRGDVGDLVPGAATLAVRHLVPLSGLIAGVTDRQRDVGAHAWRIRDAVDPRRRRRCRCEALCQRRIELWVAVAVDLQVPVGDRAARGARGPGAPAAPCGPVAPAGICPFLKLLASSECDLMLADVIVPFAICLPVIRCDAANAVPPLTAIMSAIVEVTLAYVSRRRPDPLCPKVSPLVGEPVPRRGRPLRRFGREALYLKARSAARRTYVKST